MRQSDWHIFFAFVGVTRLELATSRPPDAYSNQLSYTPIIFQKRCFVSQKRCKGRELFLNFQMFAIKLTYVNLKLLF